jgi:plastocyanin
MKLLRSLLLIAGMVSIAASAAAQNGKYVTVKGQITWPGELPKLVAVDVKADKPVCCKDGPLMPTDVEVDPKTKGIKNVVVWVRPDTENRADTFPQDKIHPDLLKPKSVAHIIDQPKCQFEPRVLIARAGDTLEVKNSATIAHNVNYTSGTESFNKLIPAGGSIKLEKPLEAQRTQIPLACNIHPWMLGWVRVFDHPYYAITDKDGNFEIKNLPSGKWRLVYWHEGGYHKAKDGILGFPIVVAPEKPGGSTMDLKPLPFEMPPK